MLKRKAPETFKSKVSIRQPGGEKHVLDIEYRHKRKDEAADYFREASASGKSSADQLLDLVASWSGLDYTLTTEDLAELEQEWPSVCHQIVMAYADELVSARLGN